MGSILGGLLPFWIGMPGARSDRETSRADCVAAEERLAHDRPRQWR